MLCFITCHFCNDFFICSRSILLKNFWICCMKNQRMNVVLSRLTIFSKLRKLLLIKSAKCRACLSKNPKGNNWIRNFLMFSKMKKVKYLKEIYINKKMRWKLSLKTTPPTMRRLSIIRKIYPTAKKKLLIKTRTTVIAIGSFGRFIISLDCINSTALWNIYFSLILCYSF